MSRIFISHATPDNAKTCAIIQWITRHGWPADEVFVDFDSIAGGERWREALSQAATRCEAVLFLISPEWAGRPWCKGEATTAQLLGKKIIPVLIEPTPIEDYGPLLRDEYQLVDLTVAGPRRAFEITMPDSGRRQTVELAESGLQALRIGLERAGFAPSSFPLVPGRPIYPGLAPLDIDDAAVFFGRDAEIARGLKELRLTRDRGESLLAILAASGAGKSSFLRAGLWPRLQRADTEFLVLPVLRPGVDALNGEQGLVASLHGAGEALGLNRNRADWRGQLDDGDLAGALTLLQTAARARLPAAVLAQARSAPQSHAADAAPNAEQTTLPPIPVLPIDQTEELFGPQGGEAARRVLDLLGAALREGRLIALCAIRTDRYASLQTAPALAGLTQRPFSLPPIAEGALKEVIEGPAQRDREARDAEGLRIDPQLTDRLLRDWADADGLPLLAFTLRRLLNDYGSDGQLTLQDYEHSGQLSGALEAAIDRAMQAATAAGTLPEGSQEREALIRKTFVPLLVSVDPQSQKPLRRIALRSELPAETRDLIDRLIDARLLTCDRPHDSDATVEVAHEAILHHWPLLDRIIRQEREALIVLNEVKRDAGAWLASREGKDAAENDDALLHRGERLRHAEQHLASEDFQSALGNDGRRYLAACRSREAQEIEDKRLQQERETRQIATAKKIQRWFTAILTAAGAIILASGLYLSRLQTTTSQASSNVLANFSENAFDRNQYDSAARFALAGIRKQNSTIQAIDISAAQTQLHRAIYRSTLLIEFSHEEDVVDADISADGHRIATAAGKTVYLLDIASGQKIATMEHNEKVTNVAFSPDGKRIFTASENKTARFWSGITGKYLIELNQNKTILNAKFSPDGNRIITTCSDATAQVFDVPSGRMVTNVQHGDPIANAYFSNDGRRIITKSNNGTSRLWDILSSQILMEMKNDGTLFITTYKSKDRNIITKVTHEAAIIWNAESGENLPTIFRYDNPDIWMNIISPDGRRIITFGKIKALWDTLLYDDPYMMEFDDDIETAIFSADSRRILTISRDNTSQLRDSASGELLTIMQHDDTINNARFSPDGRYIITASEDNTARVWHAKTDLLIMQAKHDDPVSQAAYSPDNRHIVTSSTDNTARVWDTKTGKQVTIMQHNNEVWTAKFSHDNNRIITSSMGNTVKLWDFPSGKLILTINHDHLVNSAAISPDGRHILTASHKIVKLLDSMTSTTARKLLHKDTIYSASFSHDSRYIFTASADNTMRVWDTESGELLKTFRQNVDFLSADYSPDGSHIVTVSKDNTARIWNPSSGNQIAVIKHDDDIRGAIFSPNNRQIITASDDNTVRLWDAISGKLVATMQHDKAINVGAAFSSDSQYIITISEQIVRLWDTSSGDLITAIKHNSYVTNAELSPDGSKLVVGNLDGGIRVWNLNFLALSHQELVEATCRDILNVNVDSAPRASELSRLTDDELRIAAVIDPNIERDVCRPPTRWQRFASMFGIGG